MEELLSPFKLIKEVVLATDENLNNITDVGIYVLGQPDLGSTGPNDHGYMIVIRENEVIFQTMFSIRGTIYQRYRSSNGTWNKWYKVIVSEYN